MEAALAYAQFFSAMYYYFVPLSSPTAKPRKCVLGYHPGNNAYSSHTHYWKCIVLSWIVVHFFPYLNDLNLLLKYFHKSALTYFQKGKLPVFTLVVLMCKEPNTSFKVCKYFY